MSKKITYMILFGITLCLVIIPRSLWNDGAESFLDKKPSQIGDPVKIVFNNNMIVRYQSENSRSQSQSATPITSSSDILSFLPSVDFSDSSEYNNNTETSTSGEIEGSITVQIIEVLDNGNFRIDGTHTISVNGNIEVVNIGGVVSARSIKKNGIVYSDDIIEPFITYSGISVQKRDRFSDADIITLTNELIITNVESLVDEDGIETFETNYTTNYSESLSVDESRQTELIIEYLNKILDILFIY